MSALMEIIIKATDKASNVASKVNTAFDKTSKTVTNSAQATTKASKTASTAIEGMAKSYDKVGQAATTNSSKAAQLWSQATGKIRTTVSSASASITTFIGKIGQTATTVGQKVSSSLTTAFNKAKTAAATAATGIKNSLNSAAQGADTLSGALTGVIAGFGLVEIGNAMWTGSSSKQFNEAYMAMKLGTSQAKSYVSQIQAIVAAVPGDDTYMNSLLSTSLARGAAIGDMEKLAWVTSDYIAASRMQGKALLETQMDVKEYILSGNTGQMERDSILKTQLDSLKGQGTVTERITALNAALNAEGYAGISKLDIATLKWDNIKGKIMLAATSIGDRFLPYIEKGLDYLLAMDAKTNGLSSIFIVLGGVVLALVASMSLLAGPILSAGGALGNFSKGMRGLEGASGVMGRIGGYFNTAGSAASNAATGLYRYVAAVWASNGAENTSTVTKIRSTAATIAHTIAERARALATLISSSATWKLTMAMLANPIGIIVIAIIALVAILYVLYQRNETVRNAINWLWSGLQQLGSYIMGGLMAAWNALTTALEPITSALGRLWTAISSIMKAWAQDQSKEAASQWRMLTEVANALGGVLKWVYDGLAWIVGIIVTNLNPVFQVLQIVISALAGILSGAFMAAWTTISGVVMAVIGHIARCIDIFTQLISGNITLSQALGLIWNSIKLMLAQILMSIILNIGKWAFDLINKAKAAGIGFLNGILNYIRSLPGRLWAYLLITAARIIAFANAAREKARQAGQKIVDGIKSTVKNAPKMVWDELMRIKDKIGEVATQLYNEAKNLGGKIYDGVKSALGIASPGYMYWMLHDELGRLGTSLTDNQSILKDKAALMGTAIKDGFGTPELGVAAKITSTKTDIPSVAANMGDQTLLTNQTQQAITAANTTKTGVTAAYNNMGTTVTSSLTKMVNNDKSAWLKIKTSTSTQLNSIRNSTKTVTGQMVGAWKGMKDGIVDSAEKIRSQSSKKVGDLSINIRTFYDKLTHPTKWFAGPGPSGGRRSYSINGGYAGPASTSENLLDSFLYNESPCTDCYAGGWSVSSPNNSKIKDSLYGYNVSLPGINGLNVGDFANTTNPLMGNMKLFEAVAENLISKTSYDFYYNGRYGNLEALQRGRFNCWDGAEIMVGLANAMGIPGRMIHGKWGSIGHMAAMIGGKVFDTTQRQNRGVWRGSSGVSFAGPGPVGYTRSETSTNNDSVVLTGEFTIVHDLKNVPAGLDEAMIAEIINKSAEDEGFFKRLLNNRKFLDALVKNLSVRDKRIIRGGTS